MSLEQHSTGTPEPLLIITNEGTARSGKGTTVREMSLAFKAKGEQLLVIDQGQKFRTLAHLALEIGVDLEDPEEVDEYLLTPHTPLEMRRVLTIVDGLSDRDRDEMLYTDFMSTCSAKIGASDHSHRLAVDLMHTQIGDAQNDGKSLVLIDGRTIEGHARKTPEHVGRVVLSNHFACDALIAARRVEKLFSPRKELTVEEQLRLLETADNIANRNASDMARAVDPLKRPTHALNFDYEKFTQGDASCVLDRASEVDPRHLRLMIDTTRTKSIEHMTKPLVEIALEAVRFEREVI